MAENSIVVASTSNQIYRYLEDFTSRTIYHVFVVERPERSICNMVKLNEFQTTKLLDTPPELRPHMCSDCKTVKEMIDYKDREDREDREDEANDN